MPASAEMPEQSLGSPRLAPGGTATCRRPSRSSGFAEHRVEPVAPTPASEPRVFSIQAVSARAVAPMASAAPDTGHGPSAAASSRRDVRAREREAEPQTRKAEELAEGAQHDDVAAPRLHREARVAASPTSMNASSTISRPPCWRKRSASASSASLATIRPSGLFGLTTMAIGLSASCSDIGRLRSPRWPASRASRACSA